MSSMFKKKGGLAFKPKIPLARPRPSPAVASTAKSNVSQRTSEEAVEESQTSAPETPTPAVTPNDQADDEPRTPAEGVSNIAAPPVPAEDRDSPSPVDNDEAAVSKSEAVRPPPPQADAPGQNGPSEEVIDQSGRAPIDANTTHAVSKVSTTTTGPPSPVPTPSATVEVPPQAANEHPSETIPLAEQAETTAVQSTSTATTVSTTPSEPAQKPKPATARSRARKPSAANGAANSDGDAAPKPRKRTKKPATDGEGSAQPKPRKRKTPTANGGDPAPRKRRARSVTPDDAENQVVDLQQLKMSDLTKDLHIGKKFSRHDELRDRERKARLSKGKLDNDDDQSADASESSMHRGDKSSNDPSTATPTQTPAPTAGPQFRIVDGQIVVDQSSLVMDRHARAAAAQAGQDMETIEENDFTRLITSSSFMNTSKLRGPNIWTEEETELFYHGLRMFGTDFQMISGMFRGKQRRHVKLKYNREERHCPERIDAVFNGEKTTPINLEEYQTLTGTQFEPVESIEAEHRKVQENYEAERQRIADEQAEISRKKREELFADEEGGEAGASKKKGGRRKGKQAVQYGLNGEPIASTS